MQAWRGPKINSGEPCQACFLWEILLGNSSWRICVTVFTAMKLNANKVIMTNQLYGLFLFSQHKFSLNIFIWIFSSQANTNSDWNICNNSHLHTVSYKLQVAWQLQNSNLSIVNYFKCDSKDVILSVNNYWCWVLSDTNSPTAKPL